MTKEDLLPYIELDTQAFWLNSVNPVNSDSLFIGAGITNVNQAKQLQNSDEGGRVVKALFSSTYLVNGEYIIHYMKAMVLTNRIPLLSRTSIMNFMN